MRTEALKAMTAEELEDYARAMGFTLKALTDKDDKVDMIQRRRARSVTVPVFGIDLDIEVRRFRSSRFADVIQSPRRTGEQLIGAFKGLLGDGQFSRLLDACADEDGETDEDALAVAMNRILDCEDLKNY